MFYTTRSTFVMSYLRSWPDEHSVALEHSNVGDVQARMQDYVKPVGIKTLGELRMDADSRWLEAFGSPLGKFSEA